MKCPYCDGTGELIDPQVGALILHARLSKGMTQEQVAIGASLARAQIANIESGRSDIPTKTLARIAQTLGVSMKDLVP
jgi:transcriptional regulator with XRE-family HTH domain